ncbi:MAG: N-acetylmuramoyl-L-alanine amidase-like domain-containing protein [Bdellovibrionales bacterium]
MVKKLTLFLRRFIGLPYLQDPLGEGFGKDSDPLYRFDGFDCTTFVETVLALSRSTDFQDFERRILEIRYFHGIPEFTERNHFTDKDWIPNNVRKGILTDITNYLSSETAQAEAVIDKSAWFSRVHKITHSTPPERAQLPYIKLVNLLNDAEILDRIPSGSILNIIRPNWDLKESIGTNVNVSHQGFVIRKSDGELTFRHASLQYLKIVDEPLLSYLQRMRNVPTIKGINILKPL